MLVPSRVLFAASVCLAAALGPLACDGGGPLLLYVPTDGADGGDGSLDGGDGDGSLDGSDPFADGGDAGLYPVLLSITANTAGDGPVDPGELVVSRDVVMGTAVRASLLRRSPRELEDPTLLSSLGDDAAYFASRGLVLSYTWSVVDGASNGLPPPLAGLGWGSPVVASAMRASVDLALSKLPGGASYFVVGRDVDQYLSAHPSERASFEAFAKDFLGYVRAHPLSPKGARVGVGFSFVSGAPKDASFATLFAASDMMVVSYVPGLEKVTAGSTGTIGADVDMMVEIAGDKPVMLESIGYPSSVAIGGSEVAQTLFVESTLSAILARRHRFAYVNVDMLYDLGLQRCAALAMKKGVPVDGPYATFICSLGLRTASGVDKPAWPAFLQGASAFAPP